MAKGAILQTTGVRRLTLGGSSYLLYLAAYSPDAHADRDVGQRQYPVVIAAIISLRAQLSRSDVFAFSTSHLWCRGNHRGLGRRLRRLDSSSRMP